ncbi:MAG TPA: YCF48-related protein [Cyclobacteriaceae bacterium]|nr:YCF48-related protein [Cyclobacteriaceae bacterium]
MRTLVSIFLVAASTIKLFSQDYKWQNIAVQVKSSFRALSVVDDKVAWVAGSKGWIGRSRNGGKAWSFQQVKNFEEFDFRSLYAFDSLTAIIATAGSPALILRTTDGGKTWHSVYQNDAKEAFIDGLDFWNDKKGLAYGDPIQGKMLLIATQDGGLTWRELADSQRPNLKEGEASFAASGTGIRCLGGKKVIITTGGKVSRLWTSHDEGETWSAGDLPVMQGVESAGAFSTLMWKGKKGVVVGGDYKNDAQTGQHVYITMDRGISWTLPIRPTRGLRECVEFLGDDRLIAIGPQGSDASSDGGVNWTSLSDEKGFHVVRKARDGSLIVAAGNEKISVISRK